MWLSKSRLILVDRRWRRIVFGADARRAFLAWLGLSLAGMLLGATMRTQWLIDVTVGVTLPLLFLSSAWILASTFALQAAVSFTGRQPWAGMWLLIWAGILGVAGVGGLMWLIHGLGSDAGR